MKQCCHICIHQTHTHTHTRLTALCPGLPRWAGTRKVKPIWISTEARDSEWQWHQLGHMQVCTSLQIDNHASTPPLSFFKTGCPSCRPTNSVKALKAYAHMHTSKLGYCSVSLFLKLLLDRDPFFIIIHSPVDYTASDNRSIFHQQLNVCCDVISNQLHHKTLAVREIMFLMYMKPG